MARIIYDTEAEEIIGEINDGDRIQRKSSLEEFRKTIEINKKELFIKVYIKTLFDLSKTLTGAESVFLFYVLQYINYKDGTLKYNNGKIVTKQNMANDTKQSLRTIERLLHSLISKGIMGIHKSEEINTYTVNPFLFMRGKRINNTLYDLFKNSQWAKFYESEELEEGE